MLVCDAVVLMPGGVPGASPAVEGAMRWGAMHLAARCHLRLGLAAAPPLGESGPQAASPWGPVRLE
eukprot:CAMPEP_0168425446 /NCGR_PEP_ID=MMETSP0228-20121227/35328_1 /TAXON_ID=133427 /ORGANISM="Protoceratium reticulatum, Strain CCCM 535 (=CCMP 1889)" /LENGTH=65 /DNA_ID=CAMNT_0008439439 /DNA_START=539 /DNA_END=733 /DNA_ORIENTATION=-